MSREEAGLFFRLLTRRYEKALSSLPTKALSTGEISLMSQAEIIKRPAN
jgi:hypothetical protein